MKPNLTKTLLALTSLTALSFTALAADDGKAADNTAKNERDRPGDTKVPTDQSNAPDDVKITRAIRQAVVKDKTLTATAKNVKIITTAGGHVTLRGPVASDEEKAKIEAHAVAAAGAGKVENQIEVKAAK